MFQKRFQSLLRILKPIIGVEIAVVGGLLFCLILTLQNMPVNADNGVKEGEPALVVISANWCAKCRDMSDITDNVLQAVPQADLKVITLDVDNPSTPSVAKRYGINLQGNAVPQIYLFQHGQTSLLLDANTYQLGDIDEASQSIKQQLQPH